MRPDLKNKTSDAFPVKTEPGVKPEPPDICEIKKGEEDDNHTDNHGAWLSAESRLGIVRQSAPQVRSIRRVHRNADDKIMLQEKTDGGHLKPFKCDICSINFATTNELASHQWLHTPVPRQDWWEGHRLSICTKCNIGFRLVDDFFFHQSLHDSTVSCEDDETETKALTESFQREEKDDTREELAQEKVKVKLELETATTEYAGSEYHQMVKYPEAESFQREEKEDRDIRDELPQEEVKVKLELEAATTEYANNDSESPHVVEYTEAEFGGKTDQIKAEFGKNTNDIISKQNSCTGRAKTSSDVQNRFCVTARMAVDDIGPPLSSDASGKCASSNLAFESHPTDVTEGFSGGTKDVSKRRSNLSTTRTIATRSPASTQRAVDGMNLDATVKSDVVSDKSFGNADSRDLLTHSNVPTFICECGKKKLYKSTCNLKGHLGLPPTGEKPFQCQFCSKRFCSKDCLIAHERVHTGEKTFTCGDCGQSFTSSSRFSHHLRTHLKEKPYVCDLCPKRFISTQGMARHQRTCGTAKVAERKLHQCSECDKSFTRSSYLTRHHRRIHLQEKPYGCELCPKRFISTQGMAQHQRTCTANVAERKLQCSQCDKSFTRSSHLTRHHRQVHLKEKPYGCDLCPEIITSMQGMAQHHKTLKNETTCTAYFYIFSTDVCI